MQLAVDIGGTFVDAIMFDQETGETTLEKAVTTTDPTDGVFAAIDKLDVDLDRVTTFTHGTTLGLNALLERKGATTGIITNEGFRDVFEIGRYNLPDNEMYNLTYTKPELLVPRRRRIGVPGRIDTYGEEVQTLDADAVREAAQTLREEYETESIAVCFLNAYQNPVHEQRTAEIVREIAPEVSISISSDITREYREYERTATTILDAYIKPIFESYVDALDSTLMERGFSGEFLITRSGGGAVTAVEAKTAPVHTIFSGPAGGLIGSASVGDVTNRDDLIAIDMGGTSLDVCVVQDGTPAVEYQSTIENHPVMIPVYDIRTIGAGGGSIAWIDHDLLKVGPRSAGANPGPICYARGGTAPTVTDAALALGYLDTENFLGGDMTLNEASVLDAISEQLADPLGTDLVGTCTAVLDIALANAVSALREVTVEKGLDPRDFTVIGYGGAGPMMIPLLARKVGIESIVIPQSPAVFSAWGMLMADLIKDFSRTWIELLDNTDPESIRSIFETLREKAADELEHEEFSPENRRYELTLDMRYSGQEHSVNVPISRVNDRAEIKEQFEAKHESRYGHTMDDPAEIVNLRVRAIGITDKPDITVSAPGSSEAKIGTREAYCFARKELTTFDVYRRAELSPGDEVTGPAIFQEDTTTLVMHTDQQASIDEYGQIILMTSR